MLSAEEEVRVRSHRPHSCCCCWVGAMALGLACCCCLPVVPWHDLCGCHLLRGWGWWCMSDVLSNLHALFWAHLCPRTTVTYLDKIHSCNPGKASSMLLYFSHEKEPWGAKTAVKGLATRVKRRNIFWPDQLRDTRNTCPTCLAGLGDVIVPPRSALWPESGALLPLITCLPGFPLFMSLRGAVPFLFPNIRFLSPRPLPICSGAARVLQRS